jgi:AcrR family transcriptional regulator
MAVSTQRTKRRQQREETRQQILAAAQVFLLEHTFRELSVDALMANTGHSRTVFYRHFDDIPSLVLALITEVGSEVVALGEEWAKTSRHGPDEARERLSQFVDFYVRNGPQVRAVAEAAHHDDMVEQAYAAMIEGFINLTAQTIRERAERGEVAVDDPEGIARALNWMLNGYLNDTLGRDPSQDAERILDVIWTIWTRTLFPGAG